MTDQLKTGDETMTRLEIEESIADLIAKAEAQKESLLEKFSQLRKENSELTDEQELEFSQKYQPIMDRINNLEEQRNRQDSKADSAERNRTMTDQHIKFKEARKLAGLTQGQCAELLALHPSTVAKNEVDPVHTKTARRASALSLKVLDWYQRQVPPGF